MTTLQSIYARLVTVYARMAEDTERGDVPAGS